MPATDPAGAAEIEQRLSEFVDSRFAPPLEARGIEMRAAARTLFVRTALAQVEAGIVPADRIVEAVEAMDLDGLADFYLLKFGPRPLSHNRMIRLLADMHDKWVAFRHAPRASRSGDRAPPERHER